LNIDRNIGASTAAAAGTRGGVIGAFAWIGAGSLSLVAWCWIRWIGSAHFRPVDPGPDPLPQWQAWTLDLLQWGGLLAAAYCLWRFTIRPRLKEGRFTTEGLVCLALPTLWFQDPMFGYAQTWMAYNAHLWNMGSWALEIPGWTARHPENMLEPFVTFYGYIFWMFSCMLLICAFMRGLQKRMPRLSQAALLWYGFLFTLGLDLLVEAGAIRIGWYAIPGGWRAVSLFAGTPYQLPFTEYLFGAIQTLSFAAVLFFREPGGGSFVEHGAAELKVRGGWHTGVRFLALAGALHLFFFLTFSMPSIWSGMHSDHWAAGMPSYFTAMCPEYRTQPQACGGPGIAAYRPDYVWLPAQ
jgi:hypothetical protein